MLPKMKIKNPMKTYRLEVSGEIVFIEEATSIEMFKAFAVSYLGEIDFNSLDVMIYSSDESEPLENQGYE